MSFCNNDIDAKVRNNLNNCVIVIRVDASFAIGTGHVMRCLVLAKAFRCHGADVYFICRQQKGDMLAYLQKNGYQTHIIDTGQEDYKSDAQETITFIKKLGRVDYLIVDHYNLDNCWEELVNPFVFKIMVIDDLANRAHHCDLLLDQTFGREPQEYQKWVPDGCHLLLGSRYAILKEQFAEVRLGTLQQRRFNHSLKKILVSMGGVDAKNVTQWVIHSIQESNLNVELDVILGARALHRDAVKTYLALNSSTKINLFENVNNLAEMMVEADLAIGAGGTTSWERCCLGLPTLMITTAENQNLVASQLSHVGAIEYLGCADSVETSKLIVSIKNLLNKPHLLKEMSDSAATICDGYGTNRIMAECYPQFANDGTAVRLYPATMSDAETVLNWQSDPSTRQYARIPRVPTREEHFRWFGHRLKNPGCILNMILYNKCPVGVLRLDRIHDVNHVYEVSILISPDYRRLGIASAALKLARCMFPTWELHAEILSENKASHELFLTAGYKLLNGIYVNKVSLG